MTHTYRRPTDRPTSRDASHLKMQEICYMIHTRILKIDLEIVEIIEVKVGNHHLEIDILLLHRGRKIIFMLKVATLTSIMSAISNLIFKIFVSIV